MSQSKYDREFKEQVVQRIIRSKTTTAEMAQELELHYTTVYDWFGNGSNALPGSDNSREEDAKSENYAENS